MTFEELLNQLRQYPNRVYSYVVLAALVGPLTLRIFGYGTLARWIRPLSLMVLLGGMYAKQQPATRSVN